MKLKNVKRKILATFITLSLTLNQSMMVFAAKSNSKSVSTDVPKSVSDGILLVENVVLAVVIGMGVIMTSLGLTDLAQALDARDSMQQGQAYKKVAAGFFIAAIPTILMVKIN